MLTIDLKVNTDRIYSIQVFRIEDLEDKDQVSTYRIDGFGGKTIKHKYSDGAIKLAIKVLKALDTRK